MQKRNSWKRQKGSENTNNLAYGSWCNKLRISGFKLGRVNSPYHVTSGGRHGISHLFLAQARQNVGIDTLGMGPMGWSEKNFVTATDERNDSRIKTIFSLHPRRGRRTCFIQRSNEPLSKLHDRQYWGLDWPTTKSRFLRTIGWTGIKLSYTRCNARSARSQVKRNVSYQTVQSL